MRPRAVTGLVLMALWALVSLVVVAVGWEELGDNDATLWLPFAFPGFLVPDNLLPSSVIDVLYDPRVGNFVIADIVTLALLVTTIMTLLPALRASYRVMMRVAVILGAVHVLLGFNVAFFESSLYDEEGTYAVGASLLALAVLLAWWPFTLSRRAAVPVAAPAPVAAQVYAPAPTATPAPAPAGSPQYVVQTATGSSDWLTWDQLVWMKHNGQLQVTTLVYDGVSQVTMPAGSVAGLFSS